MNKFPSIQDVALYAQVSRTTVSRFISGQGYVGKEAREKIQAAIQALNYSPSSTARSLRQGGAQTLGVILTRLESSSEMQILRGILDEAEKHHIEVIITESFFSHEKTQREIDIFRQKRVNYLIIFTDTEEEYGFLASLDIFCIFIGQEREGFSSVLFNHREAVTLLFNLILQKGHKRIGFLGIDRGDKTTGALRTEAYLSLCSLWGIEPCFQLLPHDVLKKQAFREAEKYGSFFADAKVQGVICATDSFSLGLIRYFQQTGQPCPTLCGIGTMPILKFLFPGYISIDLGYPEAGKAAVLMATEGNPSSLTVPCKLIL